jgi:ABC-type nitrate/sulfonate/bicarbonate transport system substrate-binding protein
MTDGPRLRVSTFAGAASLPLYAAKERGYFAAAGIDVELVKARDSAELMAGLVEGDFEIVHAAPDNFVAWRDRTHADIVAWIGGASGPLVLAGASEIRRVADLRGREIAIDAPQSGFVSVLRRMLRDGGVDPADVRLVPVGATDLRLEALQSGRVVATLLTLPWLLTALDDGFVIVAEQSQVVPRLQGSCGASLRGWLATHVGPADAYLRAVVAALTWLYLPASRDAVRRLIRDRFGIDDRHAEAVCNAILDPVTGWPPSARIDPVGMDLVCALRLESDRPAEEPPETYYTLEPYIRVLGSGLLGSPL